MTSSRLWLLASVVMLTPVGAFAQSTSADCDRLISVLEQQKPANRPVSLNQAQNYQRTNNAEACYDALPHQAHSASKGSPPSAAQIEQELHQDLSKAGFTDIHIMPGSFMVHAKNSKGQMTEMMISPNFMTEITAVTSSAGSGQSGSSTGSSSSTQN